MHNGSSQKSVTDILIHTGQHYDYNMSKVFFDEMGIKEPIHNLGVGSGSHGEQAGLMIRRLEDVLMKERPDVVIVYGDTNTTLSASIAAAEIHIPVVHVEAGLRSYNRYMPEELNRVITDQCPTLTAVENLRREGFKSVVNESQLITADYDFSPYKSGIITPLVVNVGDVMYDVLLSAVGIAEKKSDILKS